MSSPALTSIEVEGWKSIRSAKVELRAINVLIGANGAGKSNLVGVFGLLQAVTDRRLQLFVGQRGGANAIAHFGTARTSTIKLFAKFEEGWYGFELDATRDDGLIFRLENVSWPGGARGVGHYGSRETKVFDVPFETDSGGPPAEMLQVKALLSGARVYHFNDTGKSAPTKVTQKVDDNQFLRAEGDNIAPFLFALRKRASGAYRRVVDAVRSVAPFFDDFELAPEVLDPKGMKLGWRHVDSDAAFFADSLSDGTLRFICLATLLLQPELPSLIVIDEPELGLHPFAISKLAAMVRAAATKTQVILATQSVTLLDQFEPTDVIVAEQHNGESTFRRLDEASLKDWLADYSLGDLWLKNVLGGRPA